MLAPVVSTSVNNADTAAGLCRLRESNEQGFSDLSSRRPGGQRPQGDAYCCNLAQMPARTRPLIATPIVLCMKSERVAGHIGHSRGLARQHIRPLRLRNNLLSLAGLSPRLRPSQFQPVRMGQLNRHFPHDFVSRFCIQARRRGHRGHNHPTRPQRIECPVRLQMIDCIVVAQPCSVRRWASESRVATLETSSRRFRSPYERRRGVGPRTNS